MSYTEEDSYVDGSESGLIGLASGPEAGALIGLTKPLELEFGVRYWVGNRNQY